MSDHNDENTAPASEQDHAGPDAHTDTGDAAESHAAACVIIGEGGMVAYDQDGNVTFEARDPYLVAYKAAPIYTTLLAEQAETYDPVPYPDATNMGLARHLWNLGGEHATATFVGGIYAGTIQAETMTPHADTNVVEGDR